MLVECVLIPKTKIGHQALCIGAKYVLLQIDWCSYRVLNDHGEPVLYPKKWFRLLSKVPKCWITVRIDDKMYYRSPVELSNIAIFESWFEGALWAKQVLNDYLQNQGLSYPLNPLSEAKPLPSSTTRKSPQG